MLYRACIKKNKRGIVFMATPTKIIEFPRENEKKGNIVAEIRMRLERLEMIAACHDDSINAIHNTVCSKKPAWGAGRVK
jgi:hypothetical protein